MRTEKKSGVKERKMQNSKKKRKKRNEKMDCFILNGKMTESQIVIGAFSEHH